MIKLGLFLSTESLVIHTSHLLASGLGAVSGELLQSPDQLREVVWLKFLIMGEKSFNEM